MAQTRQFKRGGFRGYGVVFDKDNKPRIDGDPKDLHPLQQALLSDEQRRELGLWDGAWAGGANGFCKLRKHQGTYIAEEPVFALRELIDGNNVYVVIKRFDLPEGGTFKVNVKETK